MDRDTLVAVRTNGAQQQYAATVRNTQFYNLQTKYDFVQNVNTKIERQTVIPSLQYFHYLYRFLIFCVLGNNLSMEKKGVMKKEKKAQGDYKSYNSIYFHQMSGVSCSCCEQI